MQTPHTALCTAPHWLSPRPARRVRAIYPRSVPQCPQSKGREPLSRCFLRPMAFGSLLASGHASPSPRLGAPLSVSASLCQSLPACSSLASRGTRLSPTVAMPSATGSGPGLKSEESPDAPDASERPAWPCLTDALDACRPHGPLQPRLLDGWRWWWSWCLLCCRVCRCCCLLPGAGAGGFAPSTQPRVTFPCLLGTLGTQHSA
jgi:hypothetical protein